MKETSKVIMGATLVMVVSLAMVLGLILVLLAELYCSLLLRRRQLRINTSNTTTTSAMATDPSAAEASGNSSSSQPQNQSSEPPPPPTPPLSSFYSQGVLKAPRSLLFPAISLKEDSFTTLQTKKQLSQLHHQVIDIPNPKQEPNSSPSPSISLAVSPKPTTQENKAGSGNVTTTTTNTDACNDKACGVAQEHFMYISNPIYDNGESRVSGVNTPFETPDTSPSRLEMSGSSSSGEDDEVGQPLPTSPSSPLTPPLSPMKKLPAEACSVSLRDARCLGTSGSDSNSNNGLSSSSSGSPCTSPSW